jgi:type III pantothenate kinase
MIAVDVGNTSIDVAYFQEEKIKKILKLPIADVSKLSLKKALSQSDAENILVCSVVPKITAFIKNLKLPVRIAGEKLKVPIKSYYDRKKVGMDRLVGAFAARRLFPESRLVLDFGTAITLDFLARNGAYRGGLILPGVGSTLGVFSRCAMLPKRIKFKRPKKLIPTTTESSISQGLVQGFSLMINSLVEKYKSKLKINPKQPVVITGGEARLIIPDLEFPFKYEPYLILKGLGILSRLR